MGLTKKEKRDLVPDGEEFQAVYKAVYIGAVPVDVVTGTDILKAAAVSLRNKGIVPKKVWMSFSDKSISVLERTSKMDPLRRILAADINFCGYIHDNFRAEGVTGTLFGFLVNEESARLKEAHIFTFKAAARVSAPTTLRTVWEQSRKLRETLNHYDEYLRKAEVDEKDASGGGSASSAFVEAKTGGILGRFEGSYVGAVPVPADDGMGSAAVEKAVQVLRTKLAQMYLNSTRGNSTRRKRTSIHSTAPGVSERIMLTVSSEGLTTTETNTGEVMNKVFIDNISYTSVILTDQGKEIFAVINAEERLNTLSCHLYDMENGKAREVCLLIGAAFQVAAKESEADNPFHAVSSATSESFPGSLDEFFLNRKRLHAVKVIGTGTFGKVFLANLNCSELEVDGGNDGGGASARDDKPCAVKLLRGDVNAAVKADFLREAAIMAELDHDNMCKLIGVCIQQRPWLVVLEFVQYGDLREILRALKSKQIELTCPERLTFAVQISTG